MSTIPKPTLDAAIATLSDRDEYRVILDFIRDERERTFADLGAASDPHEVMKLAGGTARLDELLQILRG
jgi:histidinol-phosphate/aromatic aminotransferase/cobyric acid decarboxylase-like protein